MRKLLMVVAIGAVSAMMAHGLAHAESPNNHKQTIDNTGLIKDDYINLIKKIEKFNSDGNRQTGRKRWGAPPYYGSGGTKKIDGLDGIKGITPVGNFGR